MRCSFPSGWDHYMEPLPLRTGEPCCPMFFSDRPRKHRPQGLNLGRNSNFYNLPKIAQNTPPLDPLEDWFLDPKSQIYAPQSSHRWDWDELGEPEEKKEHQQVELNQENKEERLASVKRAPKCVPEIEPPMANNIDPLIPESPRAERSPIVSEHEDSPVVQVMCNDESPGSSVLPSSGRIGEQNGKRVLYEPPIKADMDKTPITTPIESPVEPSDTEECSNPRYCTGVIIVMLMMLEVVLTIALMLASAFKRRGKN
ncbi:hypothetical protein ACHAPU_002462 [Fusarium lateritium]